MTNPSDNQHAPAAEHGKDETDDDEEHMHVRPDASPE